MNISPVQTNPQAAFMIWNYKERLTSDPTKDPHAVESNIIINTSDLISVSTAKNKATPTGTFEVRLAPRINWVGKITPGSWCVILMSKDEIPTINPKNPGKADSKLVKMFGRIVSVRQNISVDQTTGARSTEYIISGKDWGSIFESNIYIDPIARNKIFDNVSVIGQAQRFLFNKNVTDMLDKRANLPTSGQIVKQIIELWGSPLDSALPSLKGALTESLGAAANSADKIPLITPQAQYRIPTPVAEYFNFIDNSGSQKFVNFVDILKIQQGILSDKNQYSGDVGEAYGFPTPTSIFGINTFWQILTDNSNAILNELIAEIDWRPNKGKGVAENANLTLYRRIRPFCNRSDFDGSDIKRVQEITSLFKNIKQIHLPNEHILGMNLGTNLEEKINFIEVKTNSVFLPENHGNYIKLNSQSIDTLAYGRDGLRPLIVTANYIPFKDDKNLVTAVTDWKHVLREWHFNKDTMLNGGVSFIGLNRYIAAGDNIKIDASILGAPFNKGQSDRNDNNYLLAHVEQVQHNFTVNPQTGARSFITDIKFIRGVIVDDNDNVISDTPTAINKDSQTANVEDFEHKNVVINSTEDDILK